MTLILWYNPPYLCSFWGTGTKGALEWGEASGSKGMGEGRWGPWEVRDGMRHRVEVG